MMRLSSCAAVLSREMRKASEQLAWISLAPPGPPGTRIGTRIYTRSDCSVQLGLRPGTGLEPPAGVVKRRIKPSYSVRL